MSIRALITEGIGPGGSIKYALTGGLDIGAAVAAGRPGKRSNKQWYTLPNGMRVYGTERSFKTLLDRQQAEPEAIERQEDAEQAEVAAEPVQEQIAADRLEEGAHEGDAGGVAIGPLLVDEGVRRRASDLALSEGLSLPDEASRQAEVERVAKGVAAEQFRREELQRRAQEEIDRIAREAAQAAEAFRLEQERKEIAFENEMLLALILEDMEP